jgi:hypothetical protein
MWYNPRAKLRHLPIIKVLAACTGSAVNVVVITRNDERQQSVKTSSSEHQQSINTASPEHQQSINNFGCCILYNPRVVLLGLPRIEVLATFTGNMVNVNVTTTENEHQ